MLTKKGQASIETMLILAAVLATAASLQIMGQNSFEGTNAIASARQGVETGITRISVEKEINMIISDWDLNGDDITFYLTVKGNPPPDNNYITNNVENVARSLVSTEYNINVEIGERVEI